MKFLYSINSFLSYKIAEHFYNHTHYVWCSPNFNAKGLNPPSSDPFEICQNLMKDIDGGDFHSAKISMNKTGIIKGANLNHGKGLITENQKAQIISVVEQASIEYFRPLIYVMSYEEIKDISCPAPIEIKAGFFSKEYIVEELPRQRFDIIDIYRNERYV